MPSNLLRVVWQYKLQKRAILIINVCRKKALDVIKVGTFKPEDEQGMTCKDRPTTAC